MATSVVPALIDAIVAQATVAITTATTYDGMGVTDDPDNWLMVGIDDPDADGFADTAESSQSWAHVGHTTRDEEGDITCAALAWNGDGDLKKARDDAYAITAQVENLARTDPTWGIAGILSSGFGSSTQLKQIQGQHGAAAMVVFRIHFRARI